MPESDFQTFVREGLTEVRKSCAHMADALWDLIPRVEKLERVQTVHSRLLRDHSAFMREKHPSFTDEGTHALPPIKPLSVPPPRGLGTMTDSGVWRFTETDMEAWQKKSDKLRAAEKWEAIRAGSWKVLLAVIGGGATAEVIHLLASGHM